MNSMSNNNLTRDQLGAAKGINPMEGSPQEEASESAATERREENSGMDYD